MSVEFSEEEKLLFAKEIMRLNNITNKLWKTGLDTDFLSMTHTELGVTSYDNRMKKESIRSIVPSIFNKKINTQKINTQKINTQKINKGNAPRYSVTINSKRNYKGFMSI